MAPRTLLLPALLLAVAASATQTQTALSADQDLWKGRPEGVRVTQEGTLLPGPRWSLRTELPGTVLCAAGDGETLYVGTGPTGDLFKVEGGKATRLHHFEEPLITALAVGPGGRLLVGTSGGAARVYSVDATTGQASLHSGLDAQYCWSLRARGGEVVAASGVPGALWRLAEGKAPEKLADPGADHVRCLLQEGERLWFGTAAPAALFAWEGGRARRVAVFEAEEVSALVAEGGGLLLALNHELETPSEGAPSATLAPGNGGGAGDGEGSSAGALLVRLLEGGAPRKVAAFASAVLALAPGPGGAWVGTREGGLFHLEGERLSLVGRWPDQPVGALSGPPAAPVVLTASPGALFAPAASSPGRFESPVVDAGAPARLVALDGFGAGAFSLSVRGGNGDKPDAFWGEWVPGARASTLPACRYFQWSATLEGASCEVRGVRLVHRSENRPPVFEEVKVAPPGEIQVKGSDQLGERLVQEIHAKNRPYLGLAQSMPSDSGTQTYYLQGFRMVTFKATDPDGDALRVDLFLQPEGSTAWVTLAEDVPDAFYVFESRALPDGRYRLKVVARDTLSNPEGKALSAERVVPVFAVDNTPPTLLERPRAGGRLQLDLADGGAVRAARYCLDGQPWVPLEAVSGAFGTGAASVAVPLPASGRHWLSVEAVDEQGNRAVRGFFVP